MTVRVQHLAWVSMKGEAKRDYPASINDQSPWWQDYAYVEDHFARLNTALTRGKPVVRVGVIHPVESYWLHWGPAEQTDGHSPPDGRAVPKPDRLAGERRRGFRFPLRIPAALSVPAGRCAPAGGGDGLRRGGGSGLRNPAFHDAGTAGSLPKGRRTADLSGRCAPLCGGEAGRTGETPV